MLVRVRPSTPSMSVPARQSLNADPQVVTTKPGRKMARLNGHSPYTQTDAGVYALARQGHGQTCVLWQRPRRWQVVLEMGLQRTPVL